MTTTEWQAKPSLEWGPNWRVVEGLRTIADELYMDEAHLIAAVKEMQETLEEAVNDCPDCGGKGIVYLMDETEICQSPGSSGEDCRRCAPGRAALAKSRPKP